MQRITGNGFFRSLLLLYCIWFILLLNSQLRGLNMKKIISVLLVCIMCLTLNACEPSYVCEKCGEKYEYQASKHSTRPLCNNCHNQDPTAATHYCICGNTATAESGDSYLCSDCYGKVIDAVKNVIN